MIIPKSESMVEGLENVIIYLYTKGMSVSDIESKLGFNCTKEQISYRKTSI